MEQKTAMVIFQPSGRRGKVPIGITLVEASRLLGVDIEAPCGEHQICGKCKIRIQSGVFEKFAIKSQLENAGPFQEAENEALSDEQKKDGYRLGCIARVMGDLLVDVPEASRAGKQVVSKAARNIDIKLDPGVKHYHLKLTEPTLEEGAADFERLCSALKEQTGLSSLEIDIHALRSLPGALRSGNWEITVSIWMDKEIIRVSPGLDSRGFGLAIDIGTIQ